MIKLRGEDDPDTLWVMGHLAFIYWRQGKVQKAARLGEQVLQKRIRVLGADHCDNYSAYKGIFDSHIPGSRKVGQDREAWRGGAYGVKKAEGGRRSRR